MNKVIILSELATSVARLTQSSSDEAEAFIRETFRLAAEDLEAEGKAEIPGIGVFVVTGESVAFAPDSAIAEELNAPFSAFEAIELPEGEWENDALSVVEPAEEQPSEEIAEAAEFEEREDAAPEPRPEPDPEPVSAPSVSMEHESARPVPAPPEYRSAHNSSRSSRAWYGWAASCIACLALGWFARDFVPESPIADSAVVEQTAVDHHGAAETVEAAEESAVPPVESEKPAESQPMITDTITPQRFLTTMSRAHYGRLEFWVYIYEANADRLGHPDRISAGTVVVIPSASSLGLNPDNEEQIAAAEKKAREIYARFN